MNGEILETLQARIKKELERKRLPARDRVMLESMEMLVIYLQDDHVKVQTMWNTFRPMAWALSIFASTVIALLASGQLALVIK